MRFFLALGLVGLAFAVTRLRGAELTVAHWEGRTMGSPYSVQVVGADLSTVQQAALEREVEDCLREVNRQMSHYQADSELSRFNAAPADVPFAVSPEFARVVRFSLELNLQSQGAFDPTLAPVINLWGFGEKTEQRAVPAVSDLQAALGLTGCRHLSVTPRGELIKDLPGLSVNLSAVAKGFGVDQVVGVLGRHGLTNVYVAIAGEVRVLGHSPRGGKWRIGVSAPVEHWTEDNPMVAVASLSNLAVSTSGDYQKFFVDDRGRRLSHIIDPRTGWPVQHQVGGISVVAPDSMTADALGTTLFVLGLEEGLKFIEAWPGAAALFIVREADGSFRQIASARWPRLAGASD